MIRSYVDYEEKINNTLYKCSRLIYCLFGITINLKDLYGSFHIENIEVESFVLNHEIISFYDTEYPTYKNVLFSLTIEDIRDRGYSSFDYPLTLKLKNVDGSLKFSENEFLHDCLFDIKLFLYPNSKNPEISEFDFTCLTKNNNVINIRNIPVLTNDNPNRLIEINQYKYSRLFNSDKNLYYNPIGIGRLYHRFSFLNEEIETPIYIYKRNIYPNAFPSDEERRKFEWIKQFNARLDFCGNIIDEEHKTHFIMKFNE